MRVFLPHQLKKTSPLQTHTKKFILLNGNVLITIPNPPHSVTEVPLEASGGVAASYIYSRLQQGSMHL